MSGTCSLSEIHQGAQHFCCTLDAVYMAATDLFTGTDRILDSQEPSIQGLRSGDSGGRTQSLAQESLISRRITAALWEPRLFMVTMSPGPTVGNLRISLVERAGSVSRLGWLLSELRSRPQRQICSGSSNSPVRRRSGHLAVDWPNTDKSIRIPARLRSSQPPALPTSGPGQAPSCRPGTPGS